MYPSSRAWLRWSDGFEQAPINFVKSSRWVLPDWGLPGISCDEVDKYTLKPSTVSYRSPTVSNGTLSLPANYSKWFSLGNGPFTLEMSSQPYPAIKIDRTVCNAQPMGYTCLPKRLGGKGALAPEQQYGALVAKIGENGAAFTPFPDYTLHQYRFDTQEEVFVGINDSYYADNTGEFEFQLTEPGSILNVQKVREYGNDTPTSWRIVEYKVVLSKSDGWVDTEIKVGAKQMVTVSLAKEKRLTAQDFYVRIFDLEVKASYMDYRGKENIYLSKKVDLAFVLEGSSISGPGAFIIDPKAFGNVQIKVDEDNLDNVLELKVFVRNLY